LHGDGTNGAQNNTFLDSSTNNFTITRNGNTTQGSFSPYGSNWSNFFDGTGDYLNTATNSAFAMGTGDFTAELWVYQTSVPGLSMQMLDTRNGGLNGIILAVNTSRVPYFYSGGTDVSSSTALTLNTWNHIAGVRSGSTMTLYLNGVNVASTSSTDNLTGNNCYIGQSHDLYQATVGYLSNVRLVKGTAVYTSAFTPPTTPLTAISGTSLLTCADNRFVDDSTNNFTLTVNGNTSVQRFNPFGASTAYSTSVIGGSGYFDGSGDSLSSATNFEASTSTTTFTIEGFVYPTTFSSLINVIGGIATTSGDTKSIAAEVNTSGQVALYWFDGSVKRCTGNTVMQLNAWNYFAIVVSSNTISIYVNKTTADTLSGTTTLTNRTQLQGLGIGAYYNNNAPAQYFNGYLANLRYSTIAVTISSVPTAPFASDANTRWLLSYTNAGIFDNAMMNDLETVGNAQISTSVVKYGTGSLAFDGDTDYVGFPKNENVNFGSGNFTIEFWVNWIAFGSDKKYCISVTNGSNYWQFNHDSSTGVGFLYNNGSGATTVINQGNNSGWSTDTWYHVALVRNGTALTVYRNGTSLASGTLSGALTNQTTFCIGGSAGFPTTTMNGYIDDLRITKGYARYTATFTPPTQAFPNIGPT